MKAIWTGALSFGLVHIPVRLYPAVSSKKISFRQLHTECKSPIRYKKFCPNCQRELTEEEIRRGYEYQKGKFVLLEAEELAEANPNRENIQIQAFHPQTEVDPIYFDKTYYLEAAAGGAKAYSLLREALAGEEKVAFALFQLRTDESLCLVRSFSDNLLSLTTLFYADQVRSTEEFSSGKVETTPQELEMATSLIHNLTAAFEPEKYNDQKQIALEKLIEKKLKGEEIVTAPPAGAQVIDLVEALKASVEATKKPKARKKA